MGCVVPLVAWVIPVQSVRTHGGAVARWFSMQPGAFAVVWLAAGRVGYL